MKREEVIGDMFLWNDGATLNFFYIVLKTTTSTIRCLKFGDGSPHMTFEFLRHRTIWTAYLGNYYE